MSDAMTTILRRLAPVAAAIAIFALVLQVVGYGGLEVLGYIVQGSAGSPDAVLQSLRWTVPLVIMGLGAVVSFRCGYFNVGGLGQFYLGAIGATSIATSWPDGPPWLVVSASLLAGVLFGALWSILPGILRVFLGADEVITTIMATFIAGYLLLYLVSGPLKDTAESSAQAAASAPISPALRISDSGGLSPVVIAIALIVPVLMWLVVMRTSFGLLGAIAGRNETLLRWQGAGTRALGLWAFAITGACGGLAGAIEILGPSGRLVVGLSPQVGNNAMLVALVAGLAVGGSVVAALFFGGLTSASLFLPVVAQLPNSAIVLLNGLIAILVTAQLRLPGLIARVREKRSAASDRIVEGIAK